MNAACDCDVATATSTKTISGKPKTPANNATISKLSYSGNYVDPQKTPASAYTKTCK
jgi:hypothetical protein